MVRDDRSFQPETHKCASIRIISTPRQGHLDGDALEGDQLRPCCALPTCLQSRLLKMQPAVWFMRPFTETALQDIRDKNHVQGR